MGNGGEGPVTGMTQIFWDRIKVLSWNNGGWVEGGVTKWLYPVYNKDSNEYRSWFEFHEGGDATHNKLLKLYMDRAVFNNLRNWTVELQRIGGYDFVTWKDSNNYRYRLRWEYLSGVWKVYAFRI